MASNNAVILLKGQTYGDIKEGETMKFEKRPYSFDELTDGEVIVKAMYLSIDPYLVPSLFSLLSSTVFLCPWLGLSCYS